MNAKLEAGRGRGKNIEGRRVKLPDVRSSRGRRSRLVIWVWNSKSLTTTTAYYNIVYIQKIIPFEVDSHNAINQTKSTGTGNDVL